VAAVRHSVRPVAAGGERGARLSGGEAEAAWVLESLLRGNDGVLLLDEPDKLPGTVPGQSAGSSGKLASTPKDRTCWSATTGKLLAACAQRIVTVEDRHVWVHGGPVFSVTTPRARGRPDQAGSRNCAAAGTRSTRS